MTPAALEALAAFLVGFIASLTLYLLWTWRVGG